MWWPHPLPCFYNFYDTKLVGKYPEIKGLFHNISFLLFTVLNLPVGMWSGLKQARPAGLRMEGGGNLFYGALHLPRISPPPPSPPSPQSPHTLLSCITWHPDVHNVEEREHFSISTTVKRRKHKNCTDFKTMYFFLKIHSGFALSTNTSSRKDLQSELINSQSLEDVYIREGWYLQNKCLPYFRKTKNIANFWGHIGTVSWSNKASISRKIS